MMTKQIRIILAVDDLALRKRLARVLKGTDFELHVLDSAWGILYVEILETDFLILETNDDVSALVMIVYELYKVKKTRYGLSMLALVSSESIRRNPRLEFWLIDGHAAILHLSPKDGLDVMRLPASVKYFFRDSEDND